MSSTPLDGLGIRRALGRREWGAPTPFGNGYTFNQIGGPGSIIVTIWDLETDGPWIHASRSGGDAMPTYADLCDLHHAVWGETGYAYEIHAPADQHVNLHEYARHLWGRVDGKPALPEFGRFGTI